MDVQFGRSGARRLGFALAGAALVLGAIAIPANAEARCDGLGCIDAQVPEALAPASLEWLAGDQEVTSATATGFYEYGPDRAIVYVIQAGELEQVPASVRALPVVKAFERPGGHPGFETGTTIVLEPSAALTIPTGSSDAGVLVRDAYGCEEVSFCLYDGLGFTGVFLTLQGYGTGWFNLGTWGFDDRASSMRNRRNNDSLLASGYWGAGDRYCADSHSSDDSFNNNPIDINRASSAALVPDDIHC